MALVPFPNKIRRSEELEPDWDDHDLDADDGGKMSFLEHLDELRKRIIYAVLSLAVGVAIVLFFIQRLFDFIMRPLQQLLPDGGKLIFTEPTEAFALYIKIAVIGGLVVASPAVMTQVWLFIAPGLYAHEKKLAIPFVVMSSVFFVAGVAFSHYVVFPMTWQFFVSFGNDYLEFAPRIQPAFSLYMKLLLAFGLVFQMPTVVLFLARMGVVSARFLIRNMKYAILIIFIAAAVLTPDGSPITQAAMAGPMFLLYLISIGLAWLFGKKKRVTEEAA
jgi:sec-independent protein translocase protein TatC